MRNNNNIRIKRCARNKKKHLQRERERDEENIEDKKTKNWNVYVQVNALFIENVCVSITSRSYVCKGKSQGNKQMWRKKNP